MKKPKEKYSIYRVHDLLKVKIGETFAVSEKQALNNFRFRNGGKFDYWSSGYDLIAIKEA